MASVTVPAEFFRGELRVYSDWREAFARELLQNAVDAGPTRIDITLTDTADGAKVSFEDDGAGMSLEVLEDVFFALGRTTKAGEGSIGGFGRARIIICFAQKSYRITTGRLVAEGAGGTYRVSELDGTARRGCRFDIDTLDDDSERLARAFRRLLDISNLAVPVTINGQAGSCPRPEGRAARVFRDRAGRPWARVHVSSGGVGRVVVRVRGLAMFTRWISGTDDVTVELDPARSRHTLTASRDQLHPEYAQTLETFISALGVNRRRALRPEVGSLDVRVGGGGFLCTDSPDRPDGPADTDDAGEEGGPPSGYQTVAVTPANAAAAARLGALRPTAGTGSWDLGRPGAARLGFDVYLMAEYLDATARRRARQWDPSRWGVRPGRRRALLQAWKAACAYALDVVVGLRPGSGPVVWTVGWTFDDATLALHRKAGDAHILALNPTGATKGPFAPSRRADRDRLVAYALHEACHVFAEDHDEAFAGLLTEAFAACDAAGADRAVRDAARS